MPFRKLRDAALNDGGVRAEVRWPNDDRELRGRMPAARVLYALHGPLEVTGLVDGSDGVSTGRLRVPDALAGFTVRAVSGDWTVDGQPAADGVICSPCERGRRLELGFRGSSDDGPQVRIDSKDAQLPLRRIVPADEIADAVVFFASDRSRAITGTELDVNGGEFIPA